MNEKTIEKPQAVTTKLVAKKILSISAKILIELIEQQQDLNYLYFHGARFGRSVREARYDHEHYESLKELRLRKQAVLRLHRNNYIKLRREGDRMIAILTKNGKIKALQALIRSSNKFFKDEKLCLVSFDFPEAARKARYSFRWYLKRAGFKFVQGSVWSIKKDVSKELNKLILLLKITRWVKIYIAE